jgi:hypothetical protein
LYAFEISINAVFLRLKIDLQIYQFQLCYSNDFFNCVKSVIKKLTAKIFTTKAQSHACGRQEHKDSARVKTKNLLLLSSNSTAVYSLKFHHKDTKNTKASLSIKQKPLASNL